MAFSLVPKQSPVPTTHITYNWIHMNIVSHKYCLLVYEARFSVHPFCPFSFVYLLLNDENSLVGIDDAITKWPFCSSFCNAERKVCNNSYLSDSNHV